MLVSPAKNSSLDHRSSLCFSNFEAYLLLTRYNMLMIKKLKWFKCSLSFLSLSPPQRQYIISVPFWVHTHKVFINTAFCKSTPLKTVFDVMIFLLHYQLQDLLFLRICDPPWDHWGDLWRAVEMVWVLQSWEAWLPLCYEGVLWDWENVNKGELFFHKNLYSYNPSHCTTLLNSLLVCPLLIAVIPTSWSQLWGHLKEGGMVTLWWGFTLCWVSSVSQQWQYNQVSWRQGHKCPAEVQDQRQMLEMLKIFCRK